MGHDVFISYSTKDKVAADAVCAALEQAGVRCWIAPRDILPGASWADSILKAIHASRLMVLVFSENTQSSNHIKREVERAVHRGIAIAPVRIQDVIPEGEFEYFLSSQHWMNAMTPPFERHLEELARKVRSLLEMPQLPQPRKAPEPAPVPEPAVPDAIVAPRPTAVRPAAGKSRRVALIGTLIGFIVVAVLAALLGPSLWHRIAGSNPGDAPSQSSAAPDRPMTVKNLLATAKANDDADLVKSKAALAALDELLALQPDHAEARTLRKKIAGYRRTFTNSLRMMFAEIPPGEFLMGSPETETGHLANETQHKVKLTRPYMMGVCEVTRGQFAAFVNAEGYKTDAEQGDGALIWTQGRLERRPDGSWRNVGFPQLDEHPVVCVSWNDAVAFCRWLSKTEKRTYRLPTEAEWEYAARAGTKSAYLWGDDPDQGKGWANGPDKSAGTEFPTGSTFNWDDGFTFTAPVGSFRPNAFGLYDMTGNTWEWCSDAFGEFSPGTSTDPKGFANATADASRVLRGGSWYDGSLTCRLAFRNESPPVYRYNYVGFRVCLDE